jgi:hypothetical protein
MRHLGLIRYRLWSRQRVTKPSVSDVAALSCTPLSSLPEPNDVTPLLMRLRRELLVRSLKHLLRRRLTSVNGIDNTKKSVTSFLTLLFSGNHDIEASQSYWDHEVVNELRQRFGYISVEPERFQANEAKTTSLFPLTAAFRRELLPVVRQLLAVMNISVSIAHLHELAYGAIGWSRDYSWSLATVLHSPKHGIHSRHDVPSTILLRGHSIIAASCPPLIAGGIYDLQFKIHELEYASPGATFMLGLLPLSFMAQLPTHDSIEFLRNRKSIILAAAKARGQQTPLGIDDAFDNYDYMLTRDRWIQDYGLGLRHTGIWLDNAAYTIHVLSRICSLFAIGECVAFGEAAKGSMEWFGTGDEVCVRVDLRTSASSSEGNTSSIDGVTNEAAFVPAYNISIELWKNGRYQGLAFSSETFSIAGGIRAPQQSHAFLSEPLMVVIAMENSIRHNGAHSSSLEGGVRVSISRTSDLPATTPRTPLPPTPPRIVTSSVVPPSSGLGQALAAAGIQLPSSTATATVQQRNCESIHFVTISCFA